MIPPPLPASFYDRDVVTVARELIGCLLIRHTPEGLLAGRIVETEAYREDEPASHSYGGPGSRNAPMFGPPAHAYVYLIYGMHECFNVVCGPAGRGDAVLIRALEPVAGIAQMWRNRYGTEPPAAVAWTQGGRADAGPAGDTRPAPDAGPAPGVQAAPPGPAGDAADAATRGATGDSGALQARLLNLTSGPGKLCRALDITRDGVNGTSLLTGPVTIHPGPGTLPVSGGQNGPAPAELEVTRRVGISKAVEMEWRFVEKGNPFASRPPSRRRATPR